MKSFKKHIAEVAQPRSPEEKAFKDQHSYEVKSHPVAPDAVFTGEITGNTKKARPADVKDDEKAYDAATPKKKDDGVKLESSEMDRARYDADNDSAPKKKVTLSKAPWEKKKDEELSAAQKKIDHNKNGKIDGQDLAMLRKKKQNESLDLDEGLMDKIKNKATDIRRKTLGPNAAEKDAAEKARMKRQHDSSMANIARAVSTVAKKDKAKAAKNETTSSAVKHMVNQTGPDGKTRTVMKKVRNDKSDEKGQDVIGEAVRFKKGPIRLKNGKQVMVSDQDAKLLTKMFKDLNPSNQRNMQKVLMKDVAGYEEIRGFAREAL